MTRPLDGVDLRILAELQHNGRVTAAQLSKMVGLSARSCLERVRRLEREGIITGYKAHIDVRKLVDVIVVAFARMFVKQGRDVRARFERVMRNTPEVIDCLEVSGAFNYITKCACQTLEHYDNLLAVWQKDPALGIERIESSVVMRPVKDSSIYPVELATREIPRPAHRRVGKIDLRILAALQRDGRATFRQLSEKAGLSVRPCLERVRRLERDCIITNYATRIDVRRLSSVVVAIVQLHMTNAPISGCASTSTCAVARRCSSALM